MGYFPYSTQTVITHQSNSGIQFRLYCISMELSVSLHQRSVISGSLWRSFTRTYSSHQFCPSLRWTSRVWLASSWSCSLEESWMAQICSSLKNSWTASWTLQGSCACSDKWAFSSLTHQPFTQTFTHKHTSTPHACTQVCTHAHTLRSYENSVTLNWLKPLASKLMLALNKSAS